MKLKFLIILLAAILIPGMASAQTFYKLGYCNGKVASEGNLEVDGAVAIETAIRLNASDLQRFSGDVLAGVNAGLATKLNVRSLTAWVRESLDGENLADTVINLHSTQRPRTGWNVMEFKTPVAIETGKDYYVGYTVEQTKKSSVVSFVQGTSDHASFIKTPGNNWTDRKDLGVLSIEALISGDNLPKHDLQLTDASFNADYYLAGSMISLSYSVRNEGIERVSNYTLKVWTKENPETVYEKRISQTLNYGIERTNLQTLVFEGLEPGQKYTFMAALEKPDGFDDETPADNQREICTIPVIDKIFTRTAILEEFTTEICSNCPAAAQTVHDMVEGLDADRQSRLAIVCHHAGYNTDMFTLPCDKEYLWFYNKYNSQGQIYTYAPAFMLNRVGESGMGYETPVFQNLPLSTFSEKVTRAQDVPALYSIEITGNHDKDNRKVQINVSGESILESLENPRITVYLVEDNVRPSTRPGQAGASTGFLHNHLTRAYNSTWGAPAEWTDRNYTYSCTLEYPEECDPDNMQIVAFISNLDTKNPVNCEIANGTKVNLPQLSASSIDNIGKNCAIDEKSANVYDLSGRCLGSYTDGLPAGLYILRDAHGNSSKILKSR